MATIIDVDSTDPTDAGTAREVAAYRDKLEVALLAPMGAATEAALQALATDPDTFALFPELPALAMPDGRGRHKDVLDHSIKVVAKTSPRLQLRLAALLHDLGKPATRVFAEDGSVSFTDHEAVGARLARARLRTLGFSAELVAGVGTIVFMSGRFKTSPEWSDSAVRRLARDAGDCLEDLLELDEVDVTSKHIEKHRAQQRQIAALRVRLDEVAAVDAAKAERPDLDGAGVMALLGIGPGPQVGLVMSALLEAKRERGAPLAAEEAVELARRTFAQGSELL